MRAAGVKFVRRNAAGPISLVRWGKLEIPLRPPVQDCAVGGTSGGDLIVLVGGVREQLDVYLVQSGGEYRRYSTEGGRRMPRRFNGGHGSWPVVESRHLVLLVISRDAIPRFRALDFRARVQASRQLPAAVEGFVVRSDADRGEVEIEFGAAAPRLGFRHPLAPHLELSRGLLQFGVIDLGSASGQLLQLRNSGTGALKVRIENSPEGFALVGASVFELSPGQR